MRTSISIRNLLIPSVRSRHAFTLIEMLVSIGIVALLIGILVPALGKAHGQSRELASAVNLRSIGTVFEMYISSARGLYPAPVPGRMYQTPIPIIQISMFHWSASDEWPYLFADTYPWQEYEQMYLAPGAERDTSIRPVITTVLPSFQYSASFLGHPRIWNGEKIEDTEWEQLERSVRQSMVRYSSAKALMWDVEMPYIRRPLAWDISHNLLEKTPILFADQHVEHRIPASANIGVLNPNIFATHRDENLHNTRDGVYGRDY